MEFENLVFTCPGLDNGGRFPQDLTGRGRNLSPEFRIENLSPDAKSLAVTLEDLSHPIRNFTHWVIWNLPAADRIPPAIPAGASLPALNGAMQGIAYGFHRYAGPKPPLGSTHAYCFTLYALDCRLSLNPNTFKRGFLKSSVGHILQQGRLMASA